MKNYELSKQIQQIEKEIDVLQNQMVLLQNRRRELQTMQAKNEPLRKKLLARNRLDINRMIDTICLKKTELWGLREHELPRT